MAADVWMRPCVLGVRHALDAVNAGFELQLCEDACPLDLGDDLFEATGRALARRDDIDLPALGLGIALVHAEEVAGEKRGLVTAGPGADFQDGALLVGIVLGEQRDLELAGQRVEMRLALVALVFGQRPHFGVERGIVEHGRDTVEFTGLAAIGADRLGDVLEPGEFPGEGNEGRRIRIGGKATVDLIVTPQDEVELFLGELHGASEVAKRGSGNKGFERYRADGKSPDVMLRRP